MVIVLFGQHFAEYILTLAGGLPTGEKVIVCLSKENVKDEIPGDFQIPNKGVETVVFPMPGPGQPYLFLKAVMKFRRLVRDLNPDVVHFQEIPKGFSFVCWLLARKSMRVLTVHDVVSHPGGDSRTSLRQESIRNHMRKSADMLIVHGQKLLDLVKDLYPAIASKTRVIPHPALRVQRAPGTQAVVENQLLFFGRIAKYKGLKYLIEACLALQKKGKSFSLVVAGKGDDFLANEAGLKQLNQVTIINRRISADEIDDLFAASDIIVLPYIEASQSGVIAYALSFGKPCVASRTGSIPEMIQDHYNGLLTVPADANSLATALEELIDNRELKQKFSANALTLATTMYAAETIAQATFESYKETIKRIGR